MIWALIPAPIKRAVAWLAAAIASLGLAWMAGKRDASVRADNAALRKTEADLMTAKEVQDATNAKADAAVTGDLDRWVRDR